MSRVVISALLSSCRKCNFLYWRSILVITIRSSFPLGSYINTIGMEITCSWCDYWNTCPLVRGSQRVPVSWIHPPLPWTWKQNVPLCMHKSLQPCRLLQCSMSLCTDLPCNLPETPSVPQNSKDTLVSDLLCWFGTDPWTPTIDLRGYPSKGHFTYSPPWNQPLHQHESQSHSTKQYPLTSLIHPL